MLPDANTHHISSTHDDRVRVLSVVLFSRYARVHALHTARLFFFFFSVCSEVDGPSEKGRLGPQHYTVTHDKNKIMNKKYIYTRAIWRLLHAPRASRKDWILSGGYRTTSGASCRATASFTEKRHPMYRRAPAH